MSTAMSTKRSYVSSRGNSAPGFRRNEVHLALYALIAGVLLLVVGAQADIGILMIAGFFAAVSAGLALNSMFWASYFSKHGEPKFSIRSKFYE